MAALAVAPTTQKTKQVLTIHEAATKLGFSTLPKPQVSVFMKEKIRESWGQAGWIGALISGSCTRAKKVEQTLSMAKIGALAIGCLSFLSSLAEMFRLLPQPSLSHITTAMLVLMASLGVALTCHFMAIRTDDIIFEKIDTRWTYRSFSLDAPPADLPKKGLNRCRRLKRIRSDIKFRIIRLEKDPLIQAFDSEEWEYVYGFDGPHELVFDGKKIVPQPRAA
jgi:hypothetical protein